METARLIVRPYRDDDFPALFAILSDPTTMQFWPAPLTKEAVEAWMAKSRKSVEETGAGRLALEMKGSGEIIGDCGITGSEVNGRVENDLGYIIHHPYWRRGFALESASACLDHGLRNLGLKRIVANMAHNHYASIRVAERLGMKKECEFINSRNRNILTYLYSR